MCLVTIWGVNIFPDFFWKQYYFLGVFLNFWGKSTSIIRGRCQFYIRRAMIAKVGDIKTLGTKFIVMVFASPSYSTLAMYAMEQNDMLYSTHQILGAAASGPPS